MRAIVRTLMPCTALAVAATSAGAQDWTDTKVNEDTSTNLHNEEQVVLNPTNPQNLVSVWRDFRLGYRQVGWGYSFDGGKTWTNPGLFEDVHYPRDSDPALTINSSGHFFAMLLAYTGDTSQPNGMLLYRSTDGGVTWEDRGFAVDGVPGVFEDKEFIACDRSGGLRDGRLYVVWDRFPETNIYCVASGNDGGTWTSPRRVSDQDGNQYPIPVVGADGTLYVAWTQFYNPSIRMDRSTDGGLTFGGDRVVTTLDSPSHTINGGISAPCHPAMDCDLSGGPFDNRLYCVYMDEPSGSNDRDIFVRHSDDGGVSWTSPIRINDDAFANGRDQFHPWLTVDNTGVLTAVWLDRRQDPSNCAWHCYLSQSFDGGVTWTANQQVSTATSTWCGSPEARAAEADAAEAEATREAASDGRHRVSLPGELRELVAAGATLPESYGEIDQSQRRAGAIGEYIGVAAWDGYATPVWTDFRNGHQDVFGGYDDDRIAVSDPSAGPQSLLVAAPNPTTDLAAIRYQLPADGRVTLEVFDVSSRRIRTLVDRKLHAGEHQFAWDATNQLGERVEPGTYWLRLSAPGVSESLAIVVRP